MRAEVAAEMRVQVDEAGQQRRAAEVDEARALGNLEIRADIGDAVAIDQHHGRDERRAAAAVKQARGLDYHLITGERQRGNQCQGEKVAEFHAASQADSRPKLKAAHRVSLRYLIRGGWSASFTAAWISSAENCCAPGD